MTAVVGMVGPASSAVATADVPVVATQPVGAAEQQRTPIA